jgi:hypothetical protein
VTASSCAECWVVRARRLLVGSTLQVDLPCTIPGAMSYHVRWARRQGPLCPGPPTGASSVSPALPTHPPRIACRAASSPTTCLCHRMLHLFKLPGKNTFTCPQANGKRNKVQAQYSFVRASRSILRGSRPRRGSTTAQSRMARRRGKRRDLPSVLCEKLKSLIHLKVARGRKPAHACAVLRQRTH